MTCEAEEGKGFLLLFLLKGKTYLSPWVVLSLLNFLVLEKSGRLVW